MVRVRSSRRVSARAHTETPHQTAIPHDASPLPAAAAAVYKPGSFQDVDFISKSIGFAVGTPGSLYVTTDVTQDLRGVRFVSAPRGWAVGNDGRILTTKNGGASWKQQSSGTAAFLYTVDFVTATRGFVVGERTRPPGSTPWAVGVIQRTVTGGKVWLKSF